MVKRSNDTPQPEQVFRVVIQPVNSFTETDDLLSKLRLMSAGCGCRVLEAERIEDDEREE